MTVVTVTHTQWCGRGDLTAGWYNCEGELVNARTVYLSTLVLHRKVETVVVDSRVSWLFPWLSGRQWRLEQRHYRSIAQ